MNRITLPCLALIACSGQALASSPDAWAQFDKELVASCIKASQLKNVKPAGQPAAFDDSIGYSALLLKGQYPQAHMKNQSGTELCLYERKSKKASVTEWDNVVTPAKPSTKR